MSELVDKQVNVQKENLKKLPGFTQSSRRPTQDSRKPTKKCAIKMKQRKKKNDGRLKYFLMEEGVWPCLTDRRGQFHQSLKQPNNEGLRKFIEKFILKRKRSIWDSNSVLQIISGIALPLKLRCPTLIIVEIMYFNSIQLCEIVLSPAYIYC